MIPKPERRPRKPRARIKRSRPSPFRKRGNAGKLRELADDLMSLLTRHRAGWVCWLAGSLESRCNPLDPWQVMQMAHLFPKGAHPAGRYLEDNVRCLCNRCHEYYGHRWEAWRRLLVRRLGEPEFERLWDLVNVRSGPHDYAAFALYYRRQIEVSADVWKIRERVDALVRRGERLGVF